MSAKKTFRFKRLDIGNQRPVKLLEYIKVIEKCVGKESIKEFLPQQAGDVIATHADISESTSDIGYEPTTILEEGMSVFVSWYKSYYKIV